ncbi:MAG: hypothetical protein IJ726_00575 [Phocaeicola sp.]|nr:hypothetical protein [Phocaeicola sp.]
MRTLYLFLLIAISFLFLSCNEDEDKKLVGALYNWNIQMYVVDQDGNDLLDINNENGINIDDIQLQYYNEAGDKIPCFITHIPEIPYKDMTLVDSTINPFIGFCHTVIPHTDTNMMTWDDRFQKRWGTSGTWIINWGGKWGEDTITFKMQDKQSRHWTIERIWVNGDLSYEYLKTPLSAAVEGFVVITKQN